MDAASGFCLGNPLHAVYPALIFKLGVRPLTGNHCHHFLEAADSVLIQADDLNLPPVAVRIVGIHAVQLCCEQGRLIAARACPDFQDDVLVVIGVLGKQEDFQFMLQFLDTLLGIRQLFLSHLAHLLIVFLLKKGQAVLHVLLGLLILLISLHNGRQVCLLLHQPGKPFGILGHSRVTQHQHQFLIMD